MTMLNFEKEPFLVVLEETKSTNSYLRQVLETEKYPEGSVVMARAQTAGRGQVGNTWESEPGKNLTFSLVIYPDFILSNQQFVISQIAALSVKKTLDKYIDNVTVKWPNDIYWKDKKICGMLIENDLSGRHIFYSIIGVGLNINQQIFKSDAPNPVSLSQITGNKYDIDAVLAEFRAIFYRYYLDLLQEKDKPIADEYFRSLYRNDGFYWYEDKNGKFEAEIDSIEPTGHLVLKDKNQMLRRYAFKEVCMIL